MLSNILAPHREMSMNVNLARDNFGSAIRTYWYGL